MPIGEIGSVYVIGIVVGGIVIGAFGGFEDHPDKVRAMVTLIFWPLALILGLGMLFVALQLHLGRWIRDGGPA